MMRTMLTGLTAVILFGVTTSLVAVPQFRGQINAINEDAAVATLTYFGNPDIVQGQPLYVHDAYGKTIGRMTLMQANAGQVTASIDSGVSEIACGNFVASYESPDANDPQYFGRYEFNVKIRYQQEPRFYDVFVDRVIELDRYLTFVWEDGREYRIDAYSIDEFEMAVVADQLVMMGILLKDDVATEADAYVGVSQLTEDMMPWQERILDELRGLEVLVENQFRYTFRDIKAVEMGDLGAGVPSQLYINNMAVTDADLRTAVDDSLGQLTTGTLQTEEVITVYPVIFRFDQYRRAIVALMEQINNEIRQPTPDLEQINRLRDTLGYLRENLTMQDIANVFVVIEDANDPTRLLSDPIRLDFRGDSWQAKVNLTRGTYRYYYKLEVRAEPCNLTFDIEDPLNPSGRFDVLSRVIPIQVNDMAVPSMANGNTRGPVRTIMATGDR